jgi:hypothetical protein
LGLQLQLLVALGGKMSSPLTIGSAIGGMIFVAVAITPIPTKQHSLLRTVAAGIGCGIFVAGYCAAKADEKCKREIQNAEAEKREEEAFERDQAFKDKLAIAESQREAFVVEARHKEAARIEVAIADYTDDVRDAYVAIQDGKGRLDRCLLNQREHDADGKQFPPPEPEPESPPIVEDTKLAKESLAAKKAKLLKLINEHERGWIGQCMKKPILIYGDQGSGKSYFAEFLALCRHYLRGHEIVSIADPHFHQNRDYCWQNLVKIGIKGSGAHHNYREVNSEILAMYDRFSKRTLKSSPITSIFDEVTRYGQEEATQESAAKLGSKLSSDPRKANESPILIAHAKTLTALGGGEGFAEAIQGNFIKIKLNSNSEQEPLWRGTISGIKDEDGEPIESLKITIAAEWIRSSWIYDLFNSEDKNEDSSLTKAESNAEKLNRALRLSSDYWESESTPEFIEQMKQKWLNDTTTSEAKSASDTTPWDEVPEVAYEVPEVRNSNTSSNTFLLPESVRSAALTRILALLREAGSASDEVINLIPTEADRAVWVGIKLLEKSMTSASRDIFNMGSGGAKFKQAKTWYETLEKAFGH